MLRERERERERESERERERVCLGTPCCQCNCIDANSRFYFWVCFLDFSCQRIPTRWLKCNVGTFFFSDDFVDNFNIYMYIVGGNEISHRVSNPDEAVCISQWANSPGKNSLLLPAMVKE